MVTSTLFCLLLLSVPGRRAKSLQPRRPPCEHSHLSVLSLLSLFIRAEACPDRPHNAIPQFGCSKTEFTMSTLLSLPATIVPQTHTLIASLAFSTALFLGWFSGLWVPLCKNAVSREHAIDGPGELSGRVAGRMAPISLGDVS